jgi:hypothetical protein
VFVASTSGPRYAGRFVRVSDSVSTAAGRAAEVASRQAGRDDRQHRRALHGGGGDGATLVDDEGGSGEGEHGVCCEHRRSALRAGASSAFRTVCLLQRAEGRQRWRVARLVETTGSIVVRSTVAAAMAIASHRSSATTGGDGARSWRQRPVSSPARHGSEGATLVGAAMAAAAVRIATGTSSAFRTMCLVRTSSRWRCAAVRAAELAVAGRGSVHAENARCGHLAAADRAAAAPADGGAARGVTAGARLVPLRVRVTRCGAEGRGSCGAAAWQACSAPAWPRRCDRARCCRTGRPSASRHRARVGRRRRTVRSR